MRYLKIGLETGFWVEIVLPPDEADEVAARNFFTKIMLLPEHRMQRLQHCYDNSFSMGIEYNRHPHFHPVASHFIVDMTIEEIWLAEDM